jgi:glycosyltransferase involved in cell wall biosynthesis
VLKRPALVLDAVRMPLLAWQVEVFWTALKDQMRAAVDAHIPDVILVEHDWAARWHDDLPAGIPAALALENLSWIFYERRGMRLEARRFARFDRRQLPKFDLRLTMSEADDALVDGDSAVIPNGVDTRALTAAPLPADPVAIFTGTFGYQPNADGLDWLLDDIWPRVQAQIPGARLLVVGRDAPAARAAPGVEIAADVPEMQPWFDRARAVLVPIRSGAGTRLKVLDGLASGRAVVTTTLGAEGIAITPGEHALVADDAASFAAATVRALAHDGPAEELGKAGRALAQSTYDWRAIGARLEAVLKSLLAQRRQSQLGR